MDRSLALQGCDAGFLYEPHSVGRVVALEERRHLRGEESTPHSVIPDNHCGLNVLLGEHSRHFQPDEPSPNSDGRLGGCVSRSRVPGVAERAEIGIIPESLSWMVLASSQ